MVMGEVGVVMGKVGVAGRGERPALHPIPSWCEWHSRTHCAISALGSSHYLSATE